MSKICQLTGKKAMVGHNVSHSNKKTKRRFNINLIKKKFYLPSEDKWVTLKLTTSALKTIDKKGTSEVLRIAKTLSTRTKEILINQLSI